jgi:hypothetical protein
MISHRVLKTAAAICDRPAFRTQAKTTVVIESQPVAHLPSADEQPVAPSRGDPVRQPGGDMFEGAALFRMRPVAGAERGDSAA